MNPNLAPESEQLLRATRDLASVVSQAILLSVDITEQEMADRKQSIRSQRLALEAECVRAIAEQRPVGDSLVRLTSIIHFASDLERTVEPLPPTWEVGIPAFADLEEGYRTLVEKIPTLVNVCTEAVVRDDKGLAESALRLAGECIELSDGLRDQIRERMHRDVAWIAAGIRLIAACSPISRAALILERTAHRTIAQDPGVRRQSRQSTRMRVVQREFAAGKLARAAHS